MPEADKMDREALAAACQAVPLFPLPTSVLLPNTIMPLHVFEERYRHLVGDALETEHKLIGVPLLAEGWERDYAHQPPVHQIAGVGRIVHHEQLSDGRFNIALLGVGRIHIDRELETGFLYRTAQATLLDDRGTASGLAMHLQQLRMLLAQLIMLHPRLQPELGRFIEPPTSPVLVDALAHLVFPDPEQRQRYIEEDRIAVRADMVLEGLAGVIARSSRDVPEA